MSLDMEIIGPALVLSGVALLLAGALWLRRARRKMKSDATEEQGSRRSADTCTPLVRKDPLPASSDPVGWCRNPGTPRNLDEALTMAVYRAIAGQRVELDLTISFPERCRLFGQDVPAEGRVRIGGEGDPVPPQVEEPGEETPLF